MKESLYFILFLNMSLTASYCSLNINNPPSPSCIWQRFSEGTTRYQLVHEDGNKKVFLIKEKEQGKYVLLSRALPSSVSFTDVYSSLLEEIDMLKAFHKKGFFVPLLDDAETSEEQSFWSGTTFFVDLLFKIEGADFDLALMKHQISKLVTWDIVKSSDFRSWLTLLKSTSNF
eukprot:TRINITY_DN51322_c0_g1_i1.p1 TRINITY_DN51322_c0_g1~~TRINITY_DN51322_c0_g1_i1.p1  ORF type:complete len:173 (+),score=21.99 TRINITY_DN51322_c0_g1_i1:154-672(+)